MADFQDHEPVPEPEGFRERFDRIEETLKLHGTLLGLLCAKAGLGLPQELYEKLGVKVSVIAPPSLVSS